MRYAAWKSFCASALMLAPVLLWNGPTQAQPNPAVPEAILRGPWEQQLAVLQALAGSITAVSEPQTRSRLAEALATLHIALGGYETQVDKVIDRIVAAPEFPYIAAETSHALATQLAEIHTRFDALYTMLAVQDREDVRTAQASLDNLRAILHAKTHFERDVVRVVGSLSRQQILGFATRWWNGEERAIAVKKLVADLRQRLDGLPSSEG